jgi:hypothetical protein
MTLKNASRPLLGAYSGLLLPCRREEFATTFRFAPFGLIVAITARPSLPYCTTASEVPRRLIEGQTCGGAEGLSASCRPFPFASIR